MLRQLEYDFHHEYHQNWRTHDIRMRTETIAAVVTATVQRDGVKCTLRQTMRRFWTGGGGQACVFSVHKINFYILNVIHQKTELSTEIQQHVENVWCLLRCSLSLPTGDIAYVNKIAKLVYTCRGHVPQYCIEWRRQLALKRCECDARNLKARL